MTMAIITLDTEKLNLLDKVTRVEIIDENGRCYVNWDEKNKIEISLQDDLRTLKIFITKCDSIKQ